MPTLDEISFLQRLDEIKKDLKSEVDSHINENLQEKGVECVILMPLFEILLGFDALHDIKYESNSKVDSGRFDFLIENKFIVEAKKLNTPLTKVHKQISKYIENEDGVYYGVISNGIEFQFFIQKEFIEEFLPAEKKLMINFKKDVFHILTISIYDENFIDIIRMFSKEKYHKSFMKMTRFVLSQINMTRSTKICNNKKLNIYLQKAIKKTINIQPGIYLKDIQSGKRKEGDIVIYENKNVKIPLIIEKDGRVRLKKGQAIVKNMTEVMDSEFSPLLELVQHDWKEKDTLFTEPRDCIKIAMGRKKLSKGKYLFKP